MPNLIANPKYNPALPVSTENQPQIFASPETEIINPTTGQTALQASQGITMDSLKPAIPFQITPIKDIPIYPIAGLNVEITPPITMTQPEKEASDLTKMLQSLTEQTVGKSVYQAQQEQAQGIPELYKTQTDLSARLKAIQNEALAIPLQLQQDVMGRGVTAGGLAPIQTAALRNNAIQALSVSSLLEASRGNLTLAMDLVDRAVAQKFDPIKEQISALQSNLQLIISSPEYSLADKNRVMAQQTIQDAKLAKAKKQEDDMKKIYDLAMEAAKAGADSTTLQNIQNANTPAEALVIAGDSLGMQFRVDQEQKQFERTIKTATFNLSVDKFSQDIEEFKQTHALDIEKLGIEKSQLAITKQKMAQDYALAQQKMAFDEFKLQLDNAEKLAPDTATEMKTSILDEKIKLIDNLLVSPGLKSAVGPNWATRIRFNVFSGARAEFQGGVAQLVNKETIDTLVDLKARGGTLGALSDQERILLQSAATKIGTWEIKKNGIGTGIYNIDEATFKKELEQIKKLAIRAKERALGTYGLTSADSFLSASLPNSNSTPIYSSDVWGLAR